MDVVVVVMAAVVTTDGAVVTTDGAVVKVMWSSSMDWMFSSSSRPSSRRRVTSCAMACSITSSSSSSLAALTCSRASRSRDGTSTTSRPPLMIASLTLAWETLRARPALLNAAILASRSSAVAGPSVVTLPL